MLTEKEISLLRELKKNSRASLTSLSKRTGIAISTLFETLKQLQKKVITKHTSLLNYQGIGHNLLVCFIIKTKNKENIIRFLKEHPKVNTAYSALNGADIYAECVFKELRELIEFKEKLQFMNVDSADETFIVDEICKEEFCP